MEIAGLVFQLVECMSPSIGRRWDNHRSIYGNMETLRKKAEDLRCRKGDMESKLAMQDLVEGETELRPEVKNWFECAETINKEVVDIEEKVRNVKFFSRAGLGKIVKLKVAEVEEIYNKGVFPDSLVIQLPRRGYVKPMTSTLGGETTFKRKMEEIWACLLNNEVAKVGVYGMGGIGKTTALKHTHNRLLKDRKDDFKTVIWVTASKDSSVMSLQDKISRKLNLDLSKDDDIETRAAQLYEMLNKKMRYTLILDDLWEYYSLKEIGIPEPTSENGCKLVVTTRSLDVCRAMSCKPIAMEGLSDTEAMSLFNHVVGSYSLSFPNVAAISKEVVRECAGLPLAIVTIAGSLKDIVDINEREIALEELREHSLTESMSSGIFEQLRFSYDRLNDKRLQDCLLYCTLYPEDDIIERKSLIEHLMADGMIEEKKTRQLRIKMGQVMLNKLVGACLLNEAHDSFGQKSVKMHDLVRDMALKITSGNPRYLVKARVGLRSLSDEGDWNDHVVKVSLMDNEGLWIIPLEMEPKNCVGLSTLLLQRCNLWKISNSFFLHMQKLSVLDLSRTQIENLPESISDLTTLTALFLSGCPRLKEVPSLAKLLNLRLLDLCYLPITQVPKGLEILTKLRYLDLNDLSLESMPPGILCNLVDLQYLSLISYLSATKVRYSEIEKLRKLENVEAALHDLDDWNAFVRSLETRTRPVSYILQLGFDICRNRLLDCWGNFASKGDKVVFLADFKVRNKAATRQRPLLLPKDVEILYVEGCKLYVDSLCELASLSDVTGLRSCSVTYSDKIKYVFSYSPGIFPLLQNLEFLEMKKLPSFQGLIGVSRGTPSPFPDSALSSLKHLRISYCHKIKKLFLISLLPNLEELKLHACNKLVEIVGPQSPITSI